MKIDYKNTNEAINNKNGNELWKNICKIQKSEQNTRKERESYQIAHSEGDGGIFETIDSKTAIQEHAQLDEIQQIKRQVETITNTTSVKDCEKMNEEGRSLYDTEVEEIVTVVDKIKIAMAQSKDYQNYGDEISAQVIEGVIGNSAIANSLASKLEENDIPATQENIKDSLEALNQAEKLEPLTSANIQYMMRNHLEATVANLYKAQYSGNVEYQNPQADKINWENLQDSLQEIIQEAGFEINQENIEDAKWMIESGLSLTKESYEQLKELKGMKLPISRENIMDGIVSAIEDGKRPNEALVVKNAGILKQGKQMLDIVNSITTSQISELIEQGSPLTLEAFGQIQEQTEGQETKGREYTVNSVEPAFITATRQLEEIRLKMTLDSVVQMMKQGINVETQELEELVEHLRTIEKQAYENAFARYQVEPTEENIQLYQETTNAVEFIKEVPSYVLGRDIPFTVKNISENGSDIKAALQRANEAYETLMTAPRTDMGDSIQKAFQNVDEILKDLGLEITQNNSRAVKILGYNRMEITKDSILQIKEKDIQAQKLMKNLTPSVTLQLIRKGINPLETDITKLNQMIDEIKQESGIGEEEKFSSYLYKLEQNNAISPEERSSYIGIYRLLNQVEKTDGGAVGALVNQGAEITLKNLMMSVRTLKSQGINVEINDQFGHLEQLNVEGTNIIEQIETAYYSQLVENTLDVITPEKLKTVVNEQGSFDVVEEMPFEIFSQEIQKVQEEKEIKESLFKAQLEEFAEVRNMEDDVIKMLNDYDIPVTMDHLLAAESVLKGKGKAYKRLFEEVKKENDLSEVIKDTFKRFAEALSTPEEMAKAQNDLANTAENVMKGMLEAEEVTSVDVREMKLACKEIQIGTKLVKDERYAIPILVGDDVSVMNLKIVRGDEDKGTISISMEADKIGKIAVKLRVSQKSITGHIITQQEELQNHFNKLETSLSKEIDGEPVIEINYISSDRINQDSYQNLSLEREGKEENELQTVKLYQVAKAFVTNIQRMFSEMS